MINRTVGRFAGPVSLRQQVADLLERYFIGTLNHRSPTEGLDEIVGLLEDSKMGERCLLDSKLLSGGLRDLDAETFPALLADVLNSYFGESRQKTRERAAAIILRMAGVVAEISHVESFTSGLVFGIERGEILSEWRLQLIRHAIDYPKGSTARAAAVRATARGSSFSERTIRRYVRAYERGGYAALRRHPRSDKGKPRVKRPELKLIVDNDRG